MWVQVPPSPGVCPGCGRCGTCGRPKPAPYTQWPQPYSPYPMTTWGDTNSAKAPPYWRMAQNHYS